MLEVTKEHDAPQYKNNWISNQELLESLKKDLIGYRIYYQGKRIKSIYPEKNEIKFEDQKIENFKDHYIFHDDFDVYVLVSSYDQYKTVPSLEDIYNYKHLDNYWKTYLILKIMENMSLSKEFRIVDNR